MKNLPRCSTKTKCLLLIALVVLAALLSLCCGAAALSPREVFLSFAGRAETVESEAIVLYARLPRTLGALLAGAAFAVAGAVIQSVLSNPIAAPSVIGVNSGAGLFVALCTAFFPAAARFLPLCAFLGALTGMLVVLTIAEKTGASKMTLVLSGVAVSYVFSAGIDAVLTFVPDALSGYSDFRIGSLANLTMREVLGAAAVIVPAFALVMLLGNGMELLTLGTETARSLGVNVKAVRFALLALAAALAGAAVSFCGLIGFVGMIVPHWMRRLFGGESRTLLLVSALGGAAFLTLCDLLSRTLFAPYELPVGIVLAFLGGPFFIALLIRQRGGRRHD